MNNAIQNIFCLKRKKMCTPKYFLIIFVIYGHIATALSGEREMCTLTDEDCVFKALNAGYAAMIAGVPGVEPSDPLRKEKIAVYKPHFSYKLRNASLSGFNNITANYIRFLENGTVTFGILFPVTKINADYEIHGHLGDMILNGRGSCEIKYYNHNVDFIGQYYTSANEVDNKIYNFLSDFTFISEVKGKKSYKYEDLTNNNKALTEDQLTQLDNAVHSQVISEFMQQHIDYANDYLRIKPMDEIFTKQD